MAYASSEKRKAWLKEYMSRPDVRARIAESKKRYRSKEETKEKEKEYRKKWYSEHKEYYKKLRENNREKYNEYSRKYKAEHKTYSKKYRKENLEKYANYAKDYRKKHPETVTAHNAVRVGIERGEIKTHPCEKCGEDIAEAHHDDYTKPLEIRWLCKTCHMEWHRLNKATR